MTGARREPIKQGGGDVWRDDLGRVCEHRPVVQLRPNGDYCGRGFTGSQSTDGGRSWYYRGDIGARPRWWWRGYCGRLGFALRERE